MSLFCQQSFIPVGRQRCCPSKWCPGPGPPPNAERSLWLWEGLHRSDDHARLLGLLHQNPRSGQQQESWCKNQLWKNQSPTFSGPGPLQWVDFTTYRTRYWNDLYTFSHSWLSVKLLWSALSWKSTETSFSLHRWKSETVGLCCDCCWIHLNSLHYCINIPALVRCLPC